MNDAIENRSVDKRPRSLASHPRDARSGCVNAYYLINYQPFPQMSNYAGRQFRSDGNEFRELDKQGKRRRKPSGDYSYVAIALLLDSVGRVRADERVGVKYSTGRSTGRV